MRHVIHHLIPLPWPGCPPGNAHMHGVLNKIVCECIKKS